MKQNAKSWVLSGAIVASYWLSGTSYASPISLQVDVNITTAYNYVNSRYVSISPLAGSFNFTFDDVGAPRVCVAPSSCPNQATFPDGLSATSTLSALVPSNYGDGFGSPLVYYAPDYHAYSSGYFGAFDWAHSGTTIFDAASGEYLTHAIYLVVLGLDPSTSSTYGSALDFLLGALNDPGMFRVIAGEVWYASPLELPTSGTFTQGFDWRDNNAVIASINGQRSSNPLHTVPEPATLALMWLGLAGLGQLRRKQKTNYPAT